MLSEASNKAGNGKEMVTVIRFLQMQPPYRQGEVAGFGKAMALKYIAAGVAELLREVPRAPAVLGGDSPAAERSREARRRWEEQYGEQSA